MFASELKVLSADVSPPVGRPAENVRYLPGLRVDQIGGHMDGVEHAILIAVDRLPLDKLREGETGRNRGPFVDDHGTGNWRAADCARKQGRTMFCVNEENRLQGRRAGGCS